MELKEREHGSRQSRSEPKFKKLTTRQTIAIAELLALHCHKRSDGTCYYDTGWDDERVMVEAAPDYTSSRNDGRIGGPAGKIRLDLYGQLYHAKSPASGNIALLEDLELRVLRLEFTLSWAVGQFKALGVSPPPPYPDGDVPTPFNTEERERSE